MDLTYYFGRNEDEYSFEPDINEMLDYLFRTHGYKEILDDFSYRHYNEISDEDKKFLSDNLGYDGSKESIEYLDDEDIDYIIREFDFIEDLFYDYLPELETYFKQEAYDQWEQELLDAKAEDELRTDSYRW